jgi:hypothetical protein
LDLSYEALLELGERIGDAKPKGLPNHIINRLASKQFSGKSTSVESDRQCVVCMTDYEKNEELLGLPWYFYNLTLVVICTFIILTLVFTRLASKLGSRIVLFAQFAGILSMNSYC